MKCLILAQSELTMQALRVWRRLFLGQCLAEENPRADEIFFKLEEFRQEGGIPAYQYLVKRIETICELNDNSSDYDSTVILVDSVRPRLLNAAKHAVSWERLIAMLILSFPEVRWVFGSLAGKALEEGTSFPRMRSSLPSLFRAQYTDLFDASGIREWVRELTEESIMGPETRSDTHSEAYLVRRERSAVAVDDEPSYAYLNAYIAYRFGYRASAAYSYTLATELLDQDAVCYANSQIVPEKFIPAIVFEDVFLNFADGIPGLSKLSAPSGISRASVWPMVENDLVDQRIFITSDQRLHGEYSQHDENRRYISDERRKGHNVKVRLKPYAGIFQLWKDSDLGRRPKHFFLSPHKSTFAQHPRDHSSPGPLLWVAENLIHRAEGLLSQGVCCARHAVRGAVLATDAWELLAGRNATVSIQALRLKHNFEILAECQFAGVEHHFEIEDRLEEIHLNAERISKWFGRRRRIRASLNTEMQVLLELARTVREYGHFDEEQTLMNRVRSIHNKLWMRQRSWRRMLWPILRYIDYLLDSFPRFIISLIAWILVTATIAWILDASGTPADQIRLTGFRGAIRFSLDAFVGKSLPGQSYTKDILYGVAGVAGLLHIGAFISLIYSKITRK